MSCASCAISVESTLLAQKGIVHATVNFANASALVEFSPSQISLQQMKNALQGVGYDILIEEGEDEEESEKIKLSEYKELRIKAICSSILAFPVMVIGMFFMNLTWANWIMFAFTSPVLCWFGRSFFIHAWKQALHGKANMDTLVAISTGIAYLFSVWNTVDPSFWLSRGFHPHVYYEASSVVIAFILLGKLLEERAKTTTSFAIKKLIGLQPKTVIRIAHDGAETEIPITLVMVGDRLLVKPGDKIPVDGVVFGGASYVDESMISGEPVAVEKTVGKEVFAGTINQRGSFQFTAVKVGGDTLLAQIIRMVQEAQGSKAPVQKLVDKIAGIFVPVVLCISLLSFGIWLFIGGEQALPHAFISMVTVLVIACPCALGLATPTAIMVGIGKGAEKGILIKDAQSLEQAQKINVILLDKTGTITEGKPEVTDLWFVASIAEQKALKQILLAIESQSEHPLAEAVYRKLKEEEIAPVVVMKMESITGKGVRASYNNVNYLIGSAAFMTENGVFITEEAKNQVKKFLLEAKTVVYYSTDSLLLSVIAITDKIKQSSKDAVRHLQQEGIAVYMLTGDNPTTAQIVAKLVGINEIRSEMLPSHKAEFVRELQKKGKVVAMVGDGINDSEALAQADVSIAMGKGSDIAMDVAKMTIISSDLNVIPEAIKLSRLTVKTIRQNLFWAFIYNIIGIPIAAGILYPINGFLLNPMIASAAMALSSVSVVANSLRLRRV